MAQDEQKQLVAREALRYVVDDAWLGVGSGSTANLFIDELARIKHRIKGAIASSTKTADRLKSHGIDVEELNNVADIPVYIDGADEVTVRGEMITMARSYVARELVKLGGNPAWRMGFTTDNGNVILDVSDLAIRDPGALEDRINGIAGVVTVGLFARRGADVILLGTPNGVETLTPKR